MLLLQFWSFGTYRFNRYMVECESSTAMLSEFVNFVLIDTWWNVNQLAEGGVLKKGQVLIDTWWNVNVFQQIQFPSCQLGFNRYMVECESCCIMNTSSRKE